MLVVHKHSLNFLNIYFIESIWATVLSKIIFTLLQTNVRNHYYSQPGLQRYNCIPALEWFQNGFTIIPL